MGDVISFKPKAKVDGEAVKLVKISDSIDAIVLQNIHAGTIDARDMAALLAHRLGTLIKNIEDKEVVWDFCQKVLREQAAIDKIS